MIISAACCAVVNGEKNVFKVHRHGDFFLWMKQLHCDYDKSKVESGFIDWDYKTRTERFVSRAEAMKIARKNNQLLHEPKFDILYSEDLY